jgi:structural maintenance of chromosomes protein 6
MSRGFQFFLKGTQLSQLSDEYAICMENINLTNRVLEQKKEVLPDLKQAFKRATENFQEATKAREQKKKVDDLKIECVWAHVSQKEREFDGMCKEVAKAKTRLPKIEKSLEEAKVCLLNDSRSS